MGRDDPAALIRRRLGRVLKNKWRLERLLAVGGMGAVYEAAHRNGKRVAIKMLHPALCRDPIQRKRFLREGYAANAIGDPRVVTVDDDDVDDDGSAFLVMELLEGESLNHAVDSQDGRVSVAKVLHCTDQLLGVLEVAHAKGIVHRDIKPENLFLTKSGALKVLDFGIARQREQANPGLSDTSQMTIMGTPAYMPPEQAKGRWEHVDGRSDLWSVGATMFRLLSGHYVHDAETRSEQLGLAMTAPARSLATVAPNLDPDLIVLVDRALAYDSKDRWQSAGEMRAALRPLLGQPAESPPLPEAIEPREQIAPPTMDSISAPVVSAVNSTLSMNGRRRRIQGKKGVRPRRRLVLGLAIASVVVSGLIWSALPQRSPTVPADPPSFAAAPAAHVGASAEPSEVPSQPIVSAAPPAMSEGVPSRASRILPTSVPTRVGKRSDSSKSPGVIAGQAHSQASIPASSAPSAAAPAVPAAAANPGAPQHDPLDRRR